MTQNNTQNDVDSNINVGDSPIMNQDEQELFLNVKRSKSDESMIGRIFNLPIQAQRNRALIITIPVQTNDVSAQPQLENFKLFRKIKKEKKKNESDYSKNICGYITKKIIRQLCSPNYSNHVKNLCKKYGCEYQELKNFYLPKIEQVTGPSHIPGLLIAENDKQQKIKQAFKQFFQWFIKSRYLRYLLIEGKMADKKAYIKYKNHMLLSMLNEAKISNDSEAKIEPSDSEQSQQQNSQSPNPKNQKNNKK